MHGFPSMALDCTLGLLTLFLILVSIATSGLVEKQTGTSDPSFIVIDEWAGMWLALWPARRMVIEAFNEAGWKYALAAMLASFLLFRLFDIWKPWPVRRLEKMPGGWGVTMDDVAAGVLAGLVLYCAQLVIITH
jgi:phosphatidylglycerophosphatase A